MVTGGPGIDAEATLGEVAEAVTLQEGAPGVRSVLRALRQLTAASTKDLSRATGLPVPIVAAVGNELRRRGLLSKDRPSRLTPSGTALVAELGMDLSLDATCGECAGRELVIPAELGEAVERLSKLMEAGPGADMSLDQSHCTPQTKVRRVLALARAGVLPGGSLLLVGDDDMVSLAVAVVGEVLNAPLVRRLTVVDISEEILDYIAEVTAGFRIEVETVQHDLREPLPARLRGVHDAAMTDPPYTAEGARLFLSRVVEGLRPGPANSVFFSFGQKSPDEMLEVQQEILNLGLAANGFIRNFNEYEGSGTLGGTGFIQHLLTTGATGSSVGGSYQGPLYTRDKRARQREYECVSCGTRVPVGPGARWASVGALRADGCPNCGQGPFRPRQLVSMAELPEPEEASTAPWDAGAFDSAFLARPRPAAVGGARSVESAEPPAEGSRTGASPLEGSGPAASAGESSAFVTRPVAEGDLDAVAAFETEIARGASGDGGTLPPERHRERVAEAVREGREGMLVAARRDGGGPVGWLWVTLSEGAVPGGRSAVFHSLAAADVEEQAEVAEVLVTAGVDFAARRGATEVVSTARAGDATMRALHRRLGFQAARTTMRLPLAEGSGPDDGPVDG